MGTCFDKYLGFDATVLHATSAAKMKEVDRRMLRSISNIDARDYQEKSTLHLAPRRGHQSVMAMLVDGGADMEAECKKI
jgi:ankyrin repeat protein